MKLCSGLALAWVLLLSLTASAHAQKGRAAAPRAGGGGRPQQPQITPQQRQAMQQMQERMQRQIMSEMMAQEREMRAAAERYAAKHAKGKAQAAAAAQASGSGSKSVTPDAVQKRQPRKSAKAKANASANANASQLGTAKQEKPNSAKAAEKHRSRRREMEKRLAREATVLGGTPLATDQGTIGLLRIAHSKLRSADADYDGHRMRAMEHTATALRYLGWMATGGMGFDFGSGNMPQSQSDQMLREALLKLETAEKSLCTSAAHHQSARTAVGGAIRELHTALRIR